MGVGAVLPTAQDGAGNQVTAVPVMLVAPGNTSQGTGASAPFYTAGAGGPYQLATNQTLATLTGSTPVTGVIGKVYVWDAQFTGTSLVLQALGADNTTWRTIATLNASGTFAGEIRIGNNATIRVYNPNGTSDTAVSSSIS